MEQSEAFKAHVKKLKIQRDHVIRSNAKKKQASKFRLTRAAETALIEQYIAKYGVKKCPPKAAEGSYADDVLCTAKTSRERDCAKATLELEDIRNQPIEMRVRFTTDPVELANIFGAK